MRACAQVRAGAPCGAARAARPAPQTPLSVAMWVLKTEGPSGSLSAQYVLYAGELREAGGAEHALDPHSGTVVCACVRPLLRARGCAAQRVCARGARTEALQTRR